MSETFEPCKVKLEQVSAILQNTKWEGDTLMIFHALRTCSILIPEWREDDKSQIHEVDKNNTYLTGICTTLLSLYTDNIEFCIRGAETQASNIDWMFLPSGETRIDPITSEIIIERKCIKDIFLKELETLYHDMFDILDALLDLEHEKEWYAANFKQEAKDSNNRHDIIKKFLEEHPQYQRLTIDRIKRRLNIIKQDSKKKKGRPHSNRYRYQILELFREANSNEDYRIIYDVLSLFDDFIPSHIKETSNTRTNSDYIKSLFRNKKLNSDK